MQVPDRDAAARIPERVEREQRRDQLGPLAQLACAAGLERGALLAIAPPVQERRRPRPDGDELGYERSHRSELDRLLWEAFSGNRALEDVLARHAAGVALAVCGHTHRAREGTHAGIRGFNVGGDYHFKRLLWLSWPSGAVEARQFGEG